MKASHVESRSEVEPNGLCYIGIMSELNILILDDEEMLLDLLPMMLHPHASSVCSSLVDAKAVIERAPNNFDVILCDIMMPKGGGLDLYEWLLEAHPALAEKVVFVTGGVGQDLEGKIDATERPVLNKPFSIQKLHEALERFQ